jgi:hypothetical protein
MKHIAYIILIIGVLVSETVSQTIEHGGYVAPVMKLTSVNGQPATFLGGKAIWVIHEHFGIGAAAFGLVNQISGPASSVDHLRRNLDLGYGGLVFEYFTAPAKDLSLTVGILCAGADLRFYMPETGFPEQFLIWEPQVSCGYKLSSVVTLWAGLSYRLLAQYNDMNPLMQTDVQGLTATFSVSFGKFSSL